jgi:hypothetical protein
MRLRTRTGTSQATATQSAKTRDQPEAASRAAEPAAWVGVVVAETRPRIDVQERPIAYTGPAQRLRTAGPADVPGTPDPGRSDCRRCDRPALARAEHQCNRA